MKIETNTPLLCTIKWAKSNKSRTGSLLAGLALASSLLVQPASAAVTTAGWWHYGEAPTIQTDSSGNGRNFALGFSCAGSGNPGAGVVPFGVGGPLGTTGFISTNATYWTPLQCGAAAMWNPWGSTALSAEWNPPPTNYVIECWILPDIDRANNSTWFFASGSGDFSQPDRPARTGAGGVYFRWDYNGGDARVGAFVIPNASQGVPTEVQIGDYVSGDYTKWMHVAVVNTDGTNAFYANGVQQGASTNANTIPNGNIFAGGSPGTTPTFRGWLDELRISTFAQGQFSPADLLTRPPGPSINLQPQSASVWDGGAAPFTVVAAVDASITYQWQRGGVNLGGENSPTLILPQVSPADSGAQFRCILTASSISVTSSVATLTVVPVRTTDVNYYRASVIAEPSLVAYFPADNCLSTTLSNVVDATRHGTLEGAVTYDGRTNRAFGQRAVAFNGAGDVQIPNNPAFEFTGGNGTIEALIYLVGGAPQDGTIFAWAADGSTIGYALQANKDGSTLIYTNDSPVTLTWSVPQNLIGRLAHVALVIDNLTNVTVILDGQSLGTKNQPGLGAATGSPAWIGALGTSLVKPFSGTTDEVSVYGSALSLNTIQVHYSRFLFGTNVSAPSIVSLPGPRTVMAGTSPLLKVQLAGTLPISFQWTSNGVAIPGANASTFKVLSGLSSTAANYVLYATNAIGWTNSEPIAITFTPPPSAYSTSVAADRPIAYWRLDEAAGPTAKDSAGYHDATYSGLPVYGAASVIATENNPAVNFAAAGRTTLSNFPELNPSGAFSVELWARPNGGSQGIILGSQNRSSSRGGYVFNTFFYGTYGIDLGAPNSSVTRYYSNLAPQDGVPVHLVFAWDGVSPQGTLYVNGEPINTPQGGFSQNMNSFVNNTVQPLTIGIRYDNAFPWNGAVDEVAFYDYALSAERVTNHWSASWVASAISQQPAGVTNVEGSSVSLTVVASGYPNTYQWFKVGSGILVDTDNSDGTRHYPNGVTNTTLTIAQSKPADSGQYYVVVSNTLGGSQSANTTVLITNDTNKPTVVSVAGLGTPNTSGPTPNLVKVLFSKRIDPTTGGNPLNYSIPGTTVSGVTLIGDLRAASFGGDWREAILVTTGLTPGTVYNLTVTGVKDQTVTGNVIAPLAVPFRSPVLTQGLVYWDYYFLGSASTVDSLLGDTNYPNAPMTNRTFATFDTIGNIGDNYGDSLSGWITPTVSGSYTFFLASDDHSRLLLSPNANPASAVQIASLDGARGTFVEPGDPSTSDPQVLTAGVPYFIQTLHIEGGGADYVKVAWRISTDSTPAASLLPIPGTFLSTFAAVPAPNFNPAVYNSTTGELTLSWTGLGRLYESIDLVNWGLVPGNPPSPYIINVGAAPIKFYRVGP